MFSSVETIVKQAELLTFAEQWELLSQLVQRLRQQVLPPATEMTSSFSESLQNTRGLWHAGDGLEYQLQVRAEWDKSL